MSKPTVKSGYSISIEVNPHPKRGYIVAILSDGTVVAEKRAYSWKEAGYYVNQGMILFNPKTKEMSRPLD
jgi:hypothetical protein